MCGIAGAVSFENEDIDQYLARAVEDMHSRGPDSHGIHRLENVGLAHTRLSIVDLSEAGHQPMSSPCGQIWITFNGEIYNFPALKRQLQELGLVFRTRTDTEVLLQGYQTWGLPGLLQRIEGMFAFGLHDQRLGLLYLVRDHFGKKPLYYYQDSGSFLFGSDIRTIHRQKRACLTFDEVALDYYLTEVSVPQPRTIWKQVRQLPPGSFLQLNLRDGKTEIQRYWKLAGPDWISPSPAEAEETLRVLLTDAITRRTLADVPVGCFLSGGVDSGLVVALLSQASEGAVRTYSVGISSEENELPDARIVAERYRTQHVELMATPRLAEDLPKIVSRLGEPFADSSLLPSFCICQAMREQVKVVLSGDGGDELFGGYAEYLRAFRTDCFLERYPRWLRWFAVQADKLWARLIKRRGENLGSLWTHWRQAPHDRLYRHMGFCQRDREMLYAPGVCRELAGQAEAVLDELWRDSAGDDCADSLMRTSLRTRLLNDYLVKVDRASMMNSLEVRSPFLDKALAEWAFRLHPKLKFGPGEQKWLLKNLAEKEVDPGIRVRPKRGFGIPVKEWLRGPLREQVMQLSDTGGPLAKVGLFNLKKVSEVAFEHLSGRADHSDRIWTLLVLSLWLQQL
ncbi:asparagine synthase (glutamine-hydrolyzing) [bacterium]|nr:asparagine synthase (glutamine-hydrolyzing) [bacterium]